MINPCQQDQLLSAFLDKALPADRMDQVRDHLRGCAACRRKLAALQQTDEMIRQLPLLKPSPGFDAGFWAKVTRLEQARRWPSWVDRLLADWRPLLAAGLAAGLLAAILIFRPAATAPTAEEVFMAQNMEMLNDFELLQRLDLLENWDAVQDATKEHV